MERCGKMIKGLGMSEARPCMRSRHYLGGHRPDLTGLEFKYLKVISPGGYRQFSGGGRAFTWVVQHKLSGRKRKILAQDLINGRTGNSSSCAGGSGVFKGGKVPEYATVISHYSWIFNPNEKHHKQYKGMPFHPEWDSRKDGSPIQAYFWIIENLGHKPGLKWSLDIIQHSKGFVPGNLRWVPPGSSLQAKNQIHRTILDVSDKVFAIEAKRRGYKKI